MSMTKLEEFKQFVSSLDPKDVRKLTEWMDEYNAELWDRQIEADAQTGKLDKLISSGRKEIAAGKLRPL
jgi:hypothetical protein